MNAKSSMFRPPRMETEPQGGGSAALPAPLVKPLRHPIRWTGQKIALLLAAVTGAHIGTLVIVALYYLLFEVYHPFTAAWHSAISDPNWRHLVRGVGEGLLGGTLGQMLVWNPYRPRIRKSIAKRPSLIDRAEMFLRIPNIKDSRRLSGFQTALAPLAILIYAIPGFLISAYFLKFVHSSITDVHQALGQSYWHKVESIWTSERDQKLVGLFASIVFGRRPVKKVANDVQLWFAERRVCLNKPLRWYHIPVFKARYNDILEHGLSPDADLRHGGWEAKLMVGAVGVMFLFAGFGYYVLTVIATK